MTPRNRRSAASRDAACRLLIVAFVFFLLFPFHYHIHLVDDPATQGAGHPAHAANVHAHADAGDLDHHADSRTIEPATHVTLKSSGIHPPWVVILMYFVLTLPFLAQARQAFPLPSSHRLPRCNRHSTPPLRAPPRHC